MKTVWRRLGWLTLPTVLLTVPVSWVRADQTLTPLYHQARGGKLYDNWSTTLKIRPPKTTHPAYPAQGSRQGADTWRCKECHGWDYKGVSGRYGTGEHLTGITGIRGQEGQPVEQVVALLRNQTHQYTPAMIPDAAASQLAAFVSHGQVDMDTAIDAATGKAKGDPQKGIHFFQTICAVCHGLDGKKINFGSETDPEYLGTAAHENPWETLHKIRNGQPGQEMISLLALSLQEQMDILAYAQTLPVK